MLCFTAAISSMSVIHASAQGPCIWDEVFGRWKCPGGTTTTPADKWTAIAFSNSTMRSGSSHGQDSQDAAEQLALTNCRTAASDCKLEVWGRNTCLALSTSHPEGAYGYDNDPNRERAQAKAIAQCRAGNGKNCVVQASPCANDDPRFGEPTSVIRTNPYIGTWKLNVARSNFGKTPTSNIPKSEILEIIAGNSDDARKFTLRGVGADGKPFQMSFDGAADGNPHPTTDGGSLAFLKSGGWEARDKSSNVVETGTSSISGDGKTLTNRAVHKTPNGDVTTTMVYDKVK